MNWIRGQIRELADTQGMLEKGEDNYWAIKRLEKEVEKLGRSLKSHRDHLEWVEEGVCQRIVGLEEYLKIESERVDIPDPNYLRPKSRTMEVTRYKNKK